MPGANESTVHGYRQVVAALAVTATVAIFYFFGHTALLLAALAYFLLGLLLLLGESRTDNGWFLSSLRLNALLVQGLRSPAGLLLTIVFVVALFSWFADGIATRQGPMALGALLLTIGTVVWSHWLAPHARRVPIDQRSLLVSGLSVVDENTINDLRNFGSFEELEGAIKEAGRSEKGPGEKGNLTDNRLIPVLATLARFPNIERVKLITFQGTLRGATSFAEVENAIKKIFKHIRAVEELALGQVDLNDAGEILNHLQERHCLDKLPDHQMVFSITNGTAALTAALTLLALRGRALPVYYRQGSQSGEPLAKRVVEFENWNAQRARFALQDLLDEGSAA